MRRSKSKRDQNRQNLFWSLFLRLDFPREGCGLRRELVPATSADAKSIVAVPVRGAGCVEPSKKNSKKSSVAVPVRGAGCVVIVS